jgi:hypothetical protein
LEVALRITETLTGSALVAGCFPAAAERFSDSAQSSAWSDKFSGAPQPTTTAGNIVGLTPFRNYFSDAVSVPRLAQTLITEGF